MGHCKDKKKCEDKYVIKCLPCNIYKAGNYCLGKDFIWSDSTQPAIAVLADNVVIDLSLIHI